MTDPTLYDQNYGPPARQKPRRVNQGKLAQNLLVLALLSAIITFSVMLVADQILALLLHQPTRDLVGFAFYALFCGLLGAVAGLVYIPISGTGNEKMFNWAILAIAAVAITVYVIFGGLLQGDFDTLITLIAIIAIAATANATPSRVEAARNR